MYRPLTVVLLLSSYLLATVGSFLHRGHVCSSLDGASGLLAACCGSSCSHDVLRRCGNIDRAPAGQQFGWCDGESRPAHHHQSDQCLLCRFLVLKKSVVCAPDPTTVTECFSEQVTVVLPTLRVVELLATPDCRAPPHLA
jgi:hypothetical protein